MSDKFQFASTSLLRDALSMDIKDCDIYPKYSFRLSHADKEWLDREIEALKAGFNAGSDGKWPVVTKSVVLMAVLKRGFRFFSERVHTVLIQKQIEVAADPSRVWNALTDPSVLAQWWQPNMTLEPRVGGKFVEPWMDSCGREQMATGIVMAVEENEFIQFTWKELEWNAEETVCWFRLRQSYTGGTRVELVHSGWEVFPEAQVTALKARFDAGWGTLLGQLAELLAKE